jgi:hypothetical protein
VTFLPSSLGSFIDVYISAPLDNYLEAVDYINSKMATRDEAYISTCRVLWCKNPYTDKWFGFSMEPHSCGSVWRVVPKSFVWACDQQNVLLDWGTKEAIYEYWVKMCLTP